MTVPNTRRGFTAVVCSSCPASAHLAVLDALRAVVRESALGVLVTSRCLAGRFACATGLHGRGTMVIVQPCTAERRPIGPAHWIGPLTDPADVTTVRDWLRAGAWDPDALPARLTAGLARAAARN
ncbi:hypothetical protein E4P42_08405 [Mycobacterium sp. PS03-16]|uniref:hypothetical protein n=1 Tax=Mycobacterium sp. PS03-16 TaxID=2559611 RepID=UPI001073F53F|nr:hypothetical protein [Mycobacterium sp. PS03-16]TFV59422.1 hypothetical protein E4P42_08405 [Mycobacterium sp. PS03-16]